MKVHYEKLRISPLLFEAEDSVLTESIVEVMSPKVTVQKFEDGFFDETGAPDTFDLTFDQ